MVQILTSEVLKYKKQKGREADKETKLTLHFKILCDFLQEEISAGSIPLDEQLILDLTGRIRDIPS